MTGEQVRALVASSHRKPQQTRSRTTVDRILVAADAEFGVAGLSGGSTTSIARRAGLSVGALYRFFKDKEEIADALAAEYVADVWSQFRPLALARPGDTLGQTVGAWIERAAVVVEQHPGFCRLIEEVADGEQPSSVIQIRQLFDELMASSLRDSGEGPPAPQLLAAVQVSLTIVRGALVRFRGDAAQREHLIEALTVMVTSYLTARGAAG